MRSVKRVYDNIRTDEHIATIIKLASKGKTKRTDVKWALDNIESCTKEIRWMLETGCFWQKPSHSKTIIEKGKKRVLTVSPFFPNRILDYLVVEALKPHIKKGMYEYCVGNVDKRGTLSGKKTIERNYQKYKYYIKLDIRQFYPSVKNKLLIEFLERKIKDRCFLALCKFVIGDKDGLPIGAYFSQWFSNWYLEGLDHYIKEVLHVPFYVRYVDDMLLMGNNKKLLKRAMYNIAKFLNELGLELKEKAQVKEHDLIPIDFLGFRFSKGKTKLRLRNFKRLNLRVKRIRRKGHISYKQAAALISYVAWLKYVPGGYMYYTRKVKPYARRGEIRRVIADRAKAGQDPVLLY